MNDALAVVSSNGNVFWSRPGRIKPACKFQGLEKFPFDTLTCTMEFGSWARSGLYLRPVKLREGFSLGGSDNLHLLGYSSFGGLEFSITGLFLYQRCWYTGNSH